MSAAAHPSQAELNLFMAAPTRGTLFKRSPGRTLAVLHPVFALTGICHSIGGPLLPSLTSIFQLNDSQAGVLLFAYYSGTSLGALLCGRHHVRTLILGFLALTGACLGVTVAGRVLLYPAFLLLGICVGAPMTAVTMQAGRTFGARSAAALTFLNFSWSAGALIAPLLAARLLLGHTFRAAYVILGGAALVAALACRILLEDAPEPSPAIAPVPGVLRLRFVALFALLTFLEVGVENTTGSWLATYVLRTSDAGAAWAAASSSIYWFGFLASRGISSLLLLRVDAARVLRIAIVVGMIAAVALLAVPGTASHVAAMMILGAALAPIFPLLLAIFFAHARHSSDSRWVLSLCGFGGSVLPWCTGWVSTQTGSLRLGLITLPAALLLMISLLPMLASWTAVPRTALPEDR
jgi:fucose permease